MSYCERRIKTRRIYNSNYKVFVIPGFFTVMLYSTTEQFIRVGQFDVINRFLRNTVLNVFIVESRIWNSSSSA